MLQPPKRPLEDRLVATKPRETAAPADFELFLAESATRQDGPYSLKDWRDLAEAWRIARALESCRGNRSAAARELRIGRRTLYAKMEKLGLTSQCVT